MPSTIPWDANSLIPTLHFCLYPQPHGEHGSNSWGHNTITVLLSVPLHHYAYLKVYFSHCKRYVPYECVKHTLNER